MKIVVSLIVVSVAVLCVESAIWCGYLQCTENCDEKARNDLTRCPICKCTCGDSKCQEGYYCLRGITSATNPFANPKCCNKTDKSRDAICFLPGETNVVNALPHFE